MGDVVFVDTSVLLNVLDVPGKNSDREEVTSTFKKRVQEGHTFVIPATSVIEVGNHIAQLPDGGLRRDRARRFERFLLASLQGTPPWVVSGLVWDQTFLTGLIEGRTELHLPGLVDFASSQVGAGDAAILHERERYRSRVDVPSGQTVTIWTLDQGLAAYA